MLGRKREIPVYMFTGFLESGKTEFIKETLAADYFAVRGNTLLIICEEGESEYEKAFLQKNRVITYTVEEQELLTREKLEQLEQEMKFERVVFEWNGMWNPLELELPENWPLYQQLTLIDANTFFLYYSNMRSQFVNMLKNSEVVFVNRADREMDLLNMKRIIKAVNTGAELVFESKERTEIRQDFVEDLPYDLDAPIIEVDTKSYGIWFMDAMDNPDRYEGKLVKFTAMVYRPFGMAKNRFVPGRKAMTCCEDDTVFLGFLAKSPDAVNWQNNQWVTLTARIAIEYQKTYKGDGPVLYVENIEAAQPIKEYVQFG
ncbi:MAG: GTPase [Lachnospiraceae bacterium]|nr:GTPase [Lachnospiraceae bacterium]